MSGERQGPELDAEGEKEKRTRDGRVYEDEGEGWGCS